MNNWRWDNPHAFGDQVDGSNPQTTSSGKVKCTGNHFSWYGSDDLRAKIEPPSCRQYKPGAFLAIKPLNLDDIMDEDDDDENWPDPGAPSGGRSSPGNGNGNDNGEGEEDTQGGEKGTGKGKGTQNGKGKEKGKGKGTGKRKGIVKHTPGGDDFSRTVGLQWHKETYEADLVLATGPGNLPAVRVWTAKTDWFGSRTVQKPDTQTLGGPNPDPYPSTRRFRRFWLDPSVPISGSAFRVSQRWSHSDMLLIIVKYWHWYVTVHFRCIRRLDV